MKGNILLFVFIALIGLICSILPNKKLSDAEPQVLESIGAIASYYGDTFHGRCMANGLMFDKESLVAAHRTLPLGTRVRVRRGERSVMLTIMDRGPYIEGRHIDLSEAAARKLNMTHVGVSPVVIEVLDTPVSSERYHHRNKRCLASDEIPAASP